MNSLAVDAAVAAETASEDRLKSKVLRFLIAESTVLCVLLVNTAVFLASVVHGELKAHVGPWVQHVDTVCVVYFMVEAGLKLWAHGRRVYFGNGWNVLDFFIVVASAPVLLSSFVALPTDWMAGILMLRFARFLRVFRAMRYLQASTVLRLLKAPILAAVVLVLLKAELLDSPGTLPAWAEPWARVGYDFLIVQSMFWMLARVYGMVDELLLKPRTVGDRPQFDGLFLSFVRTFVSVACLLAGFILGLKNIGQDPWTVLAGVGIGGMAIAFAAQDTIANVISGLFLFLQRPFKIGDRITITGVTGFVESIGLRSVSLRQLSGEVVVVPNKQFTGNALVNIDARTDYRSIINIPLDAETPADQVVQALSLMRAVIAADCDLEPLHFVSFDSITPDGTFNLSMLITVAKWSPKDAPHHANELAKFMNVPTRVKTEVVRQFAQAGIRFRRCEVPVRVPSPAGF